jgi:spore coat-associated protein N
MAAVRPRIATALVALGLFAAACMGGDHGAARAAVGQATGPLIGSSLAGAAILEATGLAPGHLRTGEITMTNVGDVSGFFALGASGLVDTPLGRALDLVVEDVTPGQAGRTVFYGKLSALSTVGLGNMSQGEAHRYRFTVSLPSNADNSYQGAATAISFTWSATGEDPGETSAPTPGPPATVQKPPKATTAGGTTQAPAATLTARARQTGSGGAVSAVVACSRGCRVTLTGTAAAGGKRIKLATTRRTLLKPASVRVRIVLPATVRRALAGRHPVVVRLTLRATVGTRVMVLHRTVRIAPASR